MRGTWLHHELLFLGQTYRLWSPRLSRRQGHEHGVVWQGHEEIVGVYLCTVLLAHQSQRHRRQGQQQSLAHLRHRFRLLWINVKQRETMNSACVKLNTRLLKTSECSSTWSYVEEEYNNMEIVSMIIYQAPGFIVTYITFISVSI